MGLFNTKWFGVNKAVAVLDGIRTAVGHALGVKAVESYILEQTQARFMPRGANPVAQKGPDGIPWASPSPVTIERRKSNRNAAQAMVDTGELLEDIVITSSQPSSYGGRGWVKVGLRAGSRARKYMHVLEFGGTTPQGRPIPPRPVFGTSANQARQLGSRMYEEIGQAFK